MLKLPEMFYKLFCMGSIVTTKRRPSDNLQQKAKALYVVHTNHVQTTILSDPY